MVEIVEDWDAYLEKEYKEYYENILKQMQEQGFSKIKIAVQRMMYEKRDDLFDQFLQRYDFGDIEFEFTPEFDEE